MQGLRRPFGSRFAFEVCAAWAPPRPDDGCLCQARYWLCREHVGVRAPFGHASAFPRASTEFLTPPGKSLAIAILARHLRRSRGVKLIVSGSTFHDGTLLCIIAGSMRTAEPRTMIRA